MPTQDNPRAHDTGLEELRAANEELHRKAASDLSHQQQREALMDGTRLLHAQHERCRRDGFRSIAISASA